jgi:hypothetical protein
MAPTAPARSMSVLSAHSSTTPVLVAVIETRVATSS